MRLPTHAPPDCNPGALVDGNGGDAMAGGYTELTNDAIDQCGAGIDGDARPCVFTGCNAITVLQETHGRASLHVPVNGLQPGALAAGDGGDAVPHNQPVVIPTGSQTVPGIV